MMYEEVFTGETDVDFIAEADGHTRTIVYRLALGGWSAEWWVECICHEQLHASEPSEGTLTMPEWMIDEILSWTGLLEWQLRKSKMLEGVIWRPRLCR
jgi:hypothetical protein